MASEMGEYWRDVNGFRQNKRRGNMLASTDILSRSGIPFSTHNGGVHLVVAERWDYWPSTGLFIDRQTKKSGRGIFNLLRIVRRNS